MTEFNELDLTKTPDDMEPEEAKKTLSEFMQAHKTNQTAYDELEQELDDVQTEYEEKLDEKRERIEEFRQERAEQAAEYVKMPADILADRFSIEELDQIIDEAAESDEFSEDTESEEEEDESLTTFSDREEKGEAKGGRSTEYRERAKERLKVKDFPVGE